MNSARITNTWALVALYFTTFGGFIALTAWFPTYWAEYQSFTPIKAGLLTAVFSIMASVVRVPGGSIADKFGGERVALSAMMGIIIAVATLSFADSVSLSVVAVLLLATGMGIANAAVFKLVAVYVPEAVGGAAGWVGGLGAFGGFALPPLMGTIAGKYGEIGYARGFLVFVALAAIDLLIIFFLIKKKKLRADAIIKN